MAMPYAVTIRSEIRTNPAGQPSPSKTDHAATPAAASADPLHQLAYDPFMSV
jgi:hypothetical protein